MAWLQKGGELVLAAKWEYKVKHEPEEDLKPVPPNFWVYAVPGVTCEIGQIVLARSLYHQLHIYHYCCR